MSISVTVGNTGSLSPKLLTDLKSEAASLLSLGHDFDAFLDQPISALPASLRSTSVQYTSGNQCWTPGSLKFTLSGGVCGKISIVSSGDLLSYTDGFATTVTLGAPPAENKKCSTKVNISAPDAYVSLELDFTLSGGISVTDTSGIYGVSADGSASSSITVTFHKHCLVSDTLKAAFTAAFEGLVLPLHPDTLTHLALNDYLHYTFNAKLELGLGATVGIDKVLYCGQYKSDVPKIGSALNIAATLKPEVQAGAKLSFAYDYTGTFEATLWLSAPKTAHLHLYRSSKQTESLGLDLGVSASTNASLTTGIVPADIEAALASRIPKLGDPAFKSSVLDPANSELGKYVTEMNAKMSGWMVKSNNQKATLDLAIEKTQDRFLLTHYTIDLTQPWQPAWKLMLDGKFLEAFSLPNTGVTLDIGSGLESVFATTTSLKLSLFGKLNATWSTSDINNSKLIYAGNKHFQLICNEGKSLLTQIGNSKREIDIYFAAEADLSSDNAPASPTINLHVTLQATSDQKFARSIANMVGLLTQGQDGHLLTQTVTAIAAKLGATALLHLVFSPNTYTTRLQASTLDAHGKPDNEFPDQHNYATFAAASAQLFGANSPQNFNYNAQALDYALWSHANIVANDSNAPAGTKPGRRDIGNPSAATPYLDQQGFGNAVPLIWATLQVGASFMNLCDDLRSLVASSSTTLDSWQQLITHLQTIIKNDVDVDFIPPTALALANLCGGAPAATTGPAPGLATGSSIAVTMTY
ncbi:hypothetical protein [Granulicella paludicola]|uniref:hypothetical protein n=1 Tax=Granulicella paludicola TaxID=474951 RepID=UPI0021E0CF21|nr:hypothetical protein [Granulicella paludicola]